MPLPNESLDRINGPGAAKELEAVRLARREKEAMIQHGIINPQMESVAVRHSGIVPPDISRQIHQTGEHAIVSDEASQGFSQEEDPTLH